MKNLTKTIIVIAIIAQSFNMSAKSYTIIDFFKYGAFEINISLELNITNYNKVCVEIGYNWYDNYVYDVIHSLYDSLDLYSIKEDKLLNGIADIIVSESKDLGFNIKGYNMILAIDSQSEVDFYKKDERGEKVMFAGVTTSLIGIIILLVSAGGSN